MAFSIYHYACIFLAICVIRLLLRSILALRFHFRFGHIGFFSVNDIQYHHHKSSETALWSVNVGKVKLRLKHRPTLRSPTPFITIHVGDIHVQVHNLVALNKYTEQGNQSRVDNQLNQRLSRVSSSLKKIPWWYSLSVVKHVIKFSSALPAQLLMAGLANYVDFQVDNLTLDIEDQASIKIEQIAFNSVLFANITIPQQQQDFVDQRDDVPSLCTSYQRHSLKRAEHLFKEKFFEIMVKVDTVSIEGKNKVNILALPSGGQIVISCHLSAGCVTLKDIDLNMRIDTISLNTNPLLDLNDTIKSSLQSQPNSKQKRQASKSNIASLFRSLNFFIDSTVIETEHQGQCSSTLTLPQFNMAVVSENDVKTVDPYYKLQCSLGKIDWIVTHGQPIKMVAVPGIEMTAFIALAMMNTEPTLEPDIPDQSFNDTCLGPNKRFTNVNITIHQPKLYLDVANTAVLGKLKLKRQKANLCNKDSNDQQQHSTSKRIFYNWPRGSLSICTESPSIEIKSSIPHHNGVVSWSGVTMEIGGIYCAQKNRPVSVLPRFSEPLTTGDKIPCQSTLQRIQSHTSKPSWTNLFRRSWKTKDANAPRYSTNVEWHYKTSFQFTVQNTCVDILEDDQKQTDMSGNDLNGSAYFISMDKLECNAHGRLDVCLDQEMPLL